MSFTITVPEIGIHAVVALAVCLWYLVSGLIIRFVGPVNRLCASEEWALLPSNRRAGALFCWVISPILLPALAMFGVLSGVGRVLAGPDKRRNK